MAAVVGQDNEGGYAAVECDRSGCYAHVALRPAGDMTALELLHEACAVALDEGWLLTGLTYCPKHAAYRRDRMTGRVGEGFGWSDVASRLPDEAPRPS